MNKHIFIGAHARSGSTLLCQLLSHFHDLKVFYELFHFELDSIKGCLEEDYDGVTNHIQGVIGRVPVRNDFVFKSQEYVDFLKRKYNSQVLTFKVFPEHLPSPQLEMMLEDSKFVILLKRNVLHSYISTQIANRINSFLLVDTSVEQVCFDKLAFMKHTKLVVDYFMKIESYSKARGIPLLCIDYEYLVAADDKITFIKNLIDPFLNTTTCSQDDKVKVQLQDKRILASNKVSNPEELLAFLWEMKLVGLNDISTRSDYSFLFDLTKRFDYN